MMNEESRRVNAKFKRQNAKGEIGRRCDMVGEMR
jgi:hypothetical protein